MKQIDESTTVANKSLDDQIAKLDAQIFASLTHRRNASIVAGLALIAQRKLLGHGEWLAHFEAVLEPNGLKLRTAQRWMRRAKKEQVDAKNANVAHSDSGTDSGAQAIKNAAIRDKANVRAALGPKKSREGARPYSLPLHLTEEEQNALDALQKSAAWFQAEKSIVRLLRNVCIEQGLIRIMRGKS